MNLTPPSTAVFIISVILAALAIIGTLVPTLPFVSGNAFWVAIVAYIVLAVGNLFRGV